MINVTCTGCLRDYTAHRLGLRCRKCGSNEVITREAALANPPVRAGEDKLAELPEPGRSLQRFMNAEGFSREGLSRKLKSHGYKLSANFIGQMIRGRRTGCSFHNARGIVNIMRRRGWEPVEFYPGAAERGTRKHMRRDHRQWRKRHDGES